MILTVEWWSGLSILHVNDETIRSFKCQYFRSCAERKSILDHVEFLGEWATTGEDHTGFHFSWKLESEATDSPELDCLKKINSCPVWA